MLIIILVGSALVLACFLIFLFLWFFTGSTIEDDFQDSLFVDSPQDIFDENWILRIINRLR